MTDFTGCFEDARLARTGNRFYRRLIEHKTVCLRKLGQNRAGEVQLGRFIRHEKVRVSELVGAETKRVSRQVAGRHVLVLQDTSEINYQSHAGKVTGLGTVGNGVDVGMFVHPCLVLDAKTGGGIGLSEIDIWNRTEKANPRYQRLKIEEKESYRWIEAAERSKNTLEEAAHITLVSDRESDIYEYWTRVPNAKTDLIVRACRDRNVSGSGGTLYAVAEKLPGIASTLKTIAVRDQKRSQTRQATLEISYGSVSIERPRNCTDKGAPSTVTLQLVYAKERSCPIGGKAIEWRILTTHEVNDEETALEIIEWYKQRWQIEQLFRTLKKQGLDLESSGIEDGKSLARLLVLSLCAAFRIMQLVLARDGGTQQLVSDVFDAEEQTVMEALQKRLEGKTEKQKNPYDRKSLAWASWTIGRLGGWNGYKSERPAGPITMRYGLQQFHNICSGWKLHKDVCMP